MIKKYPLPFFYFFFWLCLGLCVFAYNQQVKYFFLFIAIAASASLGEWLTIFIPAKKQTIRRIFQASVGGMLFIWLSLCVGVNFQFIQIVFGCFGGIVTGALIQFMKV